MCRYLTLANEVLAMVSQQSDIPIEVIISKSRNADVVDARHLAINLLFGLGLYPQQIAKVVHQSVRTVQCAISAFSVRCKANGNLRCTFHRCGYRVPAMFTQLCERNSAHHYNCIAMWCVAFIAASIAILAHHLGLVEALSDIVAKVAKCPKCTTFWVVLGCLFLVGCDILVAVALALIMAYLSFWATFIVLALQRLYDWLWQRINKKR